MQRASAGIGQSSQRRGVTPLVLLLKRSGNISARSLDRHRAQQVGMDGGDAVGAVRADDGEIGHPDLALAALLDQAHALDAASSPGKWVRTSSARRRLISRMISRCRGSSTSNHRRGHFSSASGSSVWLV